jgi:hypothetical protein
VPSPISSIFSSPSRSAGTPKPQTKSYSFADLGKSAQAVKKDGAVIEILDSDEDDTESLESLEDLFGRRKPGNSTSLSSSPGEDDTRLEEERVKTLGMFLGNTRDRAPLVGKDKIRELRAKEQKFTFTIASLINEHFDDEEVEKNVREVREAAESAAKQSEAGANSGLDKSALAAVATTEDGDQGVARLMDAIDRTEALTSEQVYLFFGVNGLNDWQDEDPFEYPFPVGAIPQDLWRDGDNDARERTYCSGYMADLARQGRVPDEALNWTFQQIVLERSDETRQAYIDCLRKASPSWTRTNITAQEVQTVFQTLGADDASLRESVEIKPRHRLLKELPQRDSRYLAAVLDLFQAICADMDFLALSKLTSILCRLAIDLETMSDGHISTKVEGLLSRLLSRPDIETSSHVAERMLADVGKFLRHPKLQANLLSRIAASSSLSVRIRILLAQAFLGLSKPAKQAPLVPAISLDKLAHHVLTSPSFDTRRRHDAEPIDYIALRARTAILDIAISDGGKRASYADHADEQAFNKSVDRLADAIQTIETAISDPGASHMTRTEAKDDLRALHARLLYSVRTKVRPKRHIFDGKHLVDGEEVRSQERGQEFMQKFLGRKKESEKTKKEQGPEKPRLSPEIVLPNDDDKLVESQSSSASSDKSDTEKAIRQQLGLE